MIHDHLRLFRQGEGLQVERDFAPLGRQVSLSPRVPSPRGFSAEQPWPARAPELAPTATLSDAAAAAEAAGKASPTPRMADAILQVTCPWNKPCQSSGHPILIWGLSNLQRNQRCLLCLLCEMHLS